LLRELCDRGYDVVPVNLYADVIDGLECFQCLQTVKPAVEGAFADDVTAGDGTRGARLCRGRRSPGVDVSRRRTRRSKPASDRVLPEEWHSRGRRILPLHVPASDSVPASSTRIPDEAGGRVSGESGVIHV